MQIITRFPSYLFSQLCTSHGQSHCHSFVKQSFEALGSSTESELCTKARKRHKDAPVVLQSLPCFENVPFGLQQPHALPCIVMRLSLFECCIYCNIYIYIYICDCMCILYNNTYLSTISIM